MAISCADPLKDSEEEIGRKIKAVWDSNEEKLICNNTQFDITDGSLIKYAVNMKFDDFLLDLVKWKVNLNKIDESDGRTVLDYVKFHIEKEKGLGTEPILKRYYNLLREAGAKHKYEL